MLRPGAGFADKVQRELERDLFVRPRAVKQPDRRAQGLEVEKLQWVCQPVQKGLKLRSFDMAVFRKWPSPVGSPAFRTAHNLPGCPRRATPRVQQVMAPRLRVVVKLQNISLGQKRPAMVMQRTGIRIVTLFPDLWISGHFAARMTFPICPTCSSRSREICATSAVTSRSVKNSFGSILPRRTNSLLM